MPTLPALLPLLSFEANPFQLSRAGKYHAAGVKGSDVCSGAGTRLSAGQSLNRDRRTDPSIPVGRVFMRRIAIYLMALFSIAPGAGFISAQNIKAAISG